MLRENMHNKKYLFVLSFLFLITLVSAESFGFGRTEERPLNYSTIPTVNNSEYFDGYSVTSLYNYYKGLLNSVYCQLTGCNITGNVEAESFTLNGSTITDWGLNNSLHINQDNWGNDPDNWIEFINNKIDFNETKLATIYYNATSSENITGTILGNISLTQHTDGQYDEITINITERVQSPALDIRVNFTNGIDQFNAGIMRYYTSSLVGLEPLIQIWDYNEEEWETYTTITETTEYKTIEQSVFDWKGHVKDGKVQMRMYKSGTGNLNNMYYVDWLAISKGYGTPAGQEVDPLSLHKDGDNAMLGDLNLNNYNLTNILSLQMNIENCNDTFLQSAKEGTICWNSDKQTLNIVTGLGNVIQVGQENFRAVKNNAGQTIYSGDVVAVTGSSGEVQEVQLANASQTGRQHNLGMVTVPECNNNALCIITMSGEVHDINTSIFSEGDDVFLSATENGKTTNIKPNFPNYNIHLGVVTRQHEETGIIDFNPEVDFNDGVTINQLGVLTNITVLENITADHFVGNGSLLTGNIIIEGISDGLAVGPIIARSLGTGIIGTALTLDATSDTGGHKYSFLSTGTTAIQGAGSWAIYDGTAGLYRLVIEPTGAIKSLLSHTLSYPNPSTIKGGFHFDAPTTNGDSMALTFGGYGTTGSQAGVYVQTSNTYGTKMRLATTNSYATGPQTFLYGDESGNVQIPRGSLNVSSLIYSDRLVLGQQNESVNSSLDISSGDIVGDIAYFNVYEGRSPVTLCDGDWCSVNFIKQGKTLLIEKNDNWTILDIVYEEQHYTKQSFYNLVQGTEYEEIALRLNDKIKKLQDNALEDIRIKELKENCNHNWDGECFEIVRINTTYFNAVEVVQIPKTNKIQKICTRLNLKLQIETYECLEDVETGEMIDFYKFKDGCNWDETYYCEVRELR